MPKKILFTISTLLIILTCIYYKDNLTQKTYAAADNNKFPMNFGDQFDFLGHRWEYISKKRIKNLPSKDFTYGFREVTDTLHEPVNFIDYTNLQAEVVTISETQIKNLNSGIGGTAFDKKFIKAYTAVGYTVYGDIEALETANQPDGTVKNDLYNIDSYGNIQIPPTVVGKKYAHLHDGFKGGIFWLSYGGSPTYAPSKGYLGVNESGTIITPIGLDEGYSPLKFSPGPLTFWAQGPIDISGFIALKGISAELTKDSIDVREALVDTIVGNVTLTPANADNPEYTVSDSNFKVVNGEINGVLKPVIKIAKTTGLSSGTYTFTVSGKDVYGTTKTSNSVTLKVGNYRSLSGLYYTAESGMDKLDTNSKGKLGSLKASYTSGDISPYKVKYSKTDISGTTNNNSFFTVSDDGIVSLNSAITTPGTYKLSVKVEETDDAGNVIASRKSITKSFTFTIEKAVPEITDIDISFNHTDTTSNVFTYKDAAVSTNGTIGTLSMTGGTPGGETYTFADGSTTSGSFFISGNTLKVSSDLPVKNHAISIKVSDVNNKTFTKNFNVSVIAKSPDFDWSADTKDILERAYGSTFTVIAVTNDSDAVVEYGLKNNNSCATIQGNHISITCVPKDDLVVTASITNEGYAVTPLEKRIKIIKRPITLETKMEDSDGTFKENVSINYGDTVPNNQTSLKTGGSLLDFAYNDTVESLGTLTYEYKDGNTIVDKDSLKANKTYTVNPIFTGGKSSYYDITSISGTLKVNGNTANLDWNSNTKDISQKYYGDSFAIGVTGLVQGMDVTYSEKNNSSCVSIDNNGNVSITCVPPTDITLVATPSKIEGYEASAIEKTIKIKRRPITLDTKLEEKGSYKKEVSISYGDQLPQNMSDIKTGESLLGLAPGDTISKLGTISYQYKDGDNVVSDPNMKPGKTYQVTPVFSGGNAGNYEITNDPGLLKVTNKEIIDHEFYTITGKKHTQDNDWYYDNVTIKPIHPDYTHMDIENAGMYSSKEKTYGIEGENKITLSFKRMDNQAVVTATPTIKIDKSKPDVTGIEYNDVSQNALQKFLNTVSFDHFFSKEQTAVFKGSDTGGSTLDTFEYTITELDGDGNEIAGTAITQKGDKANLAANKNYKIDVYAIDKAGNKSAQAYSETISIDDKIGDLDIKAYVNGDKNRPYDGSFWIKEPLEIELKGTNTSGIRGYQYSEDGVSYEDLPGNTYTIANTSNLNSKVYYFRAIGNNGLESEKSLTVKLDKTIPDFDIQAMSNTNKINTGEVAEDDVNITLDALNQNISNVTYYYTTDSSIAAKDPLDSASGWTRVNGNINVHENGSYTYYFIAVSGAKAISNVQDISFSIQRKEPLHLNVTITSNDRPYAPGTWTNHDVTFMLDGGSEYEFAITDGSKPSANNWNLINDPSNSKHILTSNINGETYWMRIKDEDTTVQGPYRVKLDIEKPSDLNILAEGKNDKKKISFDTWINQEVNISVNAKDNYTSSDDIRYEYSLDGITWISYNGRFTLKSGTCTDIKVRAIDQAGNVSEVKPSDGKIMIDTVSPIITGIENKKEYYLPKHIEFLDFLSGIDETKTEVVSPLVIKEKGKHIVTIYDMAGNQAVVSFTIKGLPDIDNTNKEELDDIIDKVEDEYQDIKDELNDDERKEIEDWINDAKDKSSRVDRIVDDETKSEVEGVETDFDSKTELVIVNVTNQYHASAFNLKKEQEIKGIYEVKLLLDGKEIQPDGKVRIKIQYQADENTIVYEIDKDGRKKQISFKKEDGYIIFETDVLSSYAIVGNKEKEEGGGHTICATKSDVINVDTDGDGKPDYNIDIDDDGYPDVNIGPAHKPYKAEINIDTDHDGRPDVNVDVNSDCRAELNIDVDGDNKPDIEIDSDGDGKAEINLDTNEDGIANLNVLEKFDKWIPDLDVDGLIKYDTMKNLKATINVDTDNDGKADINIDIDGDGIPDEKLDEYWKNKVDQSTKSVKGAEVKHAKGGALTGDKTKWYVWFILMAISLGSMFYQVRKKLKHVSKTKQ